MSRRTNHVGCSLALVAMFGLVGCFGKGVTPNIKDGGAADRGSGATLIDSGSSVGGGGGTMTRTASSASPGTGGAADGGAAGTSAVARTAGTSGSGGLSALGGSIETSAIAGAIGGSSTGDLSAPGGGGTSALGSGGSSINGAISTSGKASNSGTTVSVDGGGVTAVGSNGGTTTPGSSSLAAGSSGVRLDAGAIDRRPDVAPDTPTLGAPGAKCSANGDCAAGNCVDDICCKTACGECNSCSTGTCTPITPGTFCGGGGNVCVSGLCQAGCWIAGQYFSSSATNPSNACQSCQPATATSGWTTKNDGASCGTGKACAAGSCQCTTGTDCGTGVCINLNGNDNNHCGSCTRVCSAGESCTSGTCACAKGAPACDGCLDWDFESGPGTTGGWAIGGEPNAISWGNGATNIQISSTRTNPNNSSSRYSLAVPVAIYESNMVPAAVTVPLCQAGTPINLAGYTLTAAVYLAGPAFAWNGGMHVNTYGPGDNNYDWGIQFFDPLKNDDWNFLNYTFTQSILVDHVSIQLDANEYWVGTMYIDDVVIARP